MTRILVTGASGFVGRSLCPQLAAAGMSVRAATRRPVANAAAAPGIEFRKIDTVGGATEWAPILQGIDAVVHLAARAHVLGADGPINPEEFREVNVEGTRSLARACVQAGVRRLVMVSSVQAVCEETGAGECLSEASPCLPSRPYGISKRDAEQALREIASGSALEFVILRPPLIYGPDVGANFLRLLRLIDRGTPLPLGLVRNQRNLLFVGNLISAITRGIVHPQAAGRVFLVADDEAFSTRGLVLQLAGLLGRPARLLPVPVPVLRLAGRILGRSDDVQRLTGSMLVSTSEIRERLDWRPPFSAANGLRATVDWYRSLNSL